MAEDLGLDAWWDEFEYRRCSATLDLRGEFILRKLREHDAAKLQIVLHDLFPEEQDKTCPPRDTLQFVEHLLWRPDGPIGNRGSRTWRTAFETRSTRYCRCA